MAFIAILSYLQAKKTLFAPIKTETFKLQLKAFEEVLATFQNKSEYDWISHFDYSKMAALNSFKMMDDYVANFFKDEVKIDQVKSQERYSDLKGAVISLDYMKSNMKLVGELPIETKQETAAPISNPAIILAKWQKYEHGIIHYTAKYEDATKDITKLASSPLLPQELRTMLTNFIKSAKDNHSQIGIVLTQCAKQLPEIFPTAEQLLKFDVNWTLAQYNRARKPLEPLSQEILAFVNKHLRIDELQKA